MAEQKSNGFDTHVVNLSQSPISVRVRSNQFVVTEQWTKLYQHIESRIKQAGGGGIDLGIEGLGALGIRGNGEKEEEKKNIRLQEDYSKLQHTLVEAGFVTIKSLQALKFTTPQEIKFVSIFIKGKLEADNFNCSDTEFVIDNDESLKTHKEPKVAKYYNEGDIFSHSYQAGMVTTLQNFKQLYYYGKDAKIVGPKVKAWVLRRETVRNIAQVGTDFTGVNLAVSEILRVIGDRWFGDSVKQLYDTGIQIETMDPKLVKAMLTIISNQALEIAEGFSVIAGWYQQLRAPIDQAKNDIVGDSKQAQIFMNECTQQYNTCIDTLNRQVKSLERNIGLCALCFLAGPIGAVGMGVGGGVFGSKLDKAKAQRREAQRNLAKMFEAKAELAETLKKIDTLSNSLVEMEDFCFKMAMYFTSQSQNFKSWGESHDTSDMNEYWKKWTGQQVVDWICDLDQEYAKYKADLSKKMSNFIKGDTIAQCNELLLGMCGVSQNDAKAISENINALTMKSQIKYRYIKSRFDFDLKWMEQQKASIAGVNKFVSKLTIDAAFTDQKIQPTQRQPVVFKQFGKEIRLDPAQKARTLLGNK